MNWRRACVAALVAVPLLVVLAMGFGHDPHAVPFMFEHKPAPEFALQALSGERITLQSLRGKPIVINFWATWCYPCQAEHDMLQSAAAQYGDKVHFLGLIYQDDAERMRQHLANRSDRYPQLMDPGSITAIDYGVGGVPESFIIDAEGIIVHKQSGVLTPGILFGTLDKLLHIPKEPH